MKTGFLGGTLAVALSSSLLLAQLGTDTTVQKEKQTGVHELQIERRDVLKELVDVLTQSYSTGNTRIEELIFARLSLLDAELELVDAADERTKLLEKRLQLFRDREERAAARAQIGDASSSYMFLAKADRLEAEIRLQKHLDQ